MKKLLSIFLIITTIGVFIYFNEKKVSAGSVNDKLVRFHVIANSDSKEDQAVKLKVRDAILQKMGPKLNRAKSAEEALSIISDNTVEIEKIADEVLKKEGKNYRSKAYVGKFDFPVKEYNTITLPAGTYNALRVVLGKGDGKNWWCVMFPPLCFIDITHGLTDEKTNEELRQVLSDKEVKSITAFKQQTEKTEIIAKDNTNKEASNSIVSASSQKIENTAEAKPKVEFRFKILDIFQSLFKKIMSIF